MFPPTDNGHDFRDQACVINHRIHRILRERGHTEQSRMKTVIPQKLRFPDGLPGAAADSADLYEIPSSPFCRVLVDHSGNGRQHRPEQVVRRIPYFELCRVDADGYPAGAGVDVISHEGPLMRLVVSSAGIEGKRNRRNHGSPENPAAYSRREFGPVHIVRS